MLARRMFPDVSSKEGTHIYFVFIQLIVAPDRVSCGVRRRTNRGRPSTSRHGPYKVAAMKNSAQPVRLVTPYW